MPRSSEVGSSPLVAWLRPFPPFSPGLTASHLGWQEVEARVPCRAPTLLSPPQQLTLTLVLATLSSSLGSGFQYGYNIAVVNTPHQVGTEGNGWGQVGYSLLQVPMAEARGQGLTAWHFGVQASHPPPSSATC